MFQERMSQEKMSQEKNEIGEISPAEEQREEEIGNDIQVRSVCGTNFQENTEKHKTGKPIATIMVAGRPNTGKSTALNNIFGFNLKAKTLAKSVTDVITVE